MSDQSRKTGRGVVADVLLGYRLVVITGGSSGIGRSFVATALEANSQMRICNLSRGSLELDRVHHITCDLARASERRERLGAAAQWIADQAESGRLLLINNAGFGAYGPLREHKMRTDLDMIEVNIAALVETTAALLPELRRRGGAIINVASTAAFQPVPLMATYAATKAFVLSWSIALARELRGSGIHVQALCPGPTRTDFQRRAGWQGKGALEKRTQEPQQVVEASLRALRRGRTVVVSGAANRLLSVAAGIAPKEWAAAIAQRGVVHYRHASDTDA